MSGSMYAWTLLDRVLVNWVVLPFAFTEFHASNTLPSWVNRART